MKTINVTVNITVRGKHCSGCRFLRHETDEHKPYIEFCVLFERGIELTRSPDRKPKRLDECMACEV